MSSCPLNNPVLGRAPTPTTTRLASSVLPFLVWACLTRPSPSKPAPEHREVQCFAVEECTLLAKQPPGACSLRMSHLAAVTNKQLCKQAKNPSGYLRGVCPQEHGPVIDD